MAEGNTSGRVIASARTTRRGQRPWHVQTLLVREPGDLAIDRSATAVGPHREGEERAARLAAILVGESPYQHRSPVDAVVISNNEKGD